MENQWKSKIVKFLKIDFHWFPIRNFRGFSRNFPNFSLSKKNVITFEGAFHGRTFAALSAQQNKKYSEAFEPLLPGFIQVPFNNLNLLEKKVNENPDSVAFSLFPAHIDDVIKVANQNLTMPPKTTWFDPKPLDGLVVYEFNQIKW